MTRGEYLRQFKALTEAMAQITADKNADYSGAEVENDALRNFNLIEKVRTTVSAEDGIFVRMTDKVARIGNLMERPATVVDEKIEDTLLDLANYSLILLILLREKSGAERQPYEVWDAKPLAEATVVEVVNGIGALDHANAYGNASQNDQSPQAQSQQESAFERLSKALGFKA